MGTRSAWRKPLRSQRRTRRRLCCGTADAIAPGPNRGPSDSHLGNTVGSGCDDYLQLRTTVSPPRMTHTSSKPGDHPAAHAPLRAWYSCSLEGRLALPRDFDKKSRTFSELPAYKLMNTVRGSRPKPFRRIMELIRPDSHFRAAAASALRLRPGVRIAPRAPSGLPDFD